MERELEAWLTNEVRIKYVSDASLSIIANHKYLRPIIENMIRLRSLSNCNDILSKYRTCNKTSQEELMNVFDKWKEIEDTKNPNSRVNLLRKLDGLRKKKMQLLSEYNASKLVQEDLNRKIVAASKLNSVVQEIDAKVTRSNLRLERIQRRINSFPYHFHSFESYPEFEPGNVLTISIEVGGLIKQLTKKSAKILDIPIQTGDHECFGVLKDLMSKYPISHILLAIGYHTDELQSKWTNGPFGDVAKVSHLAESLLGDAERTLDRKLISLQRALLESENFLVATHKTESIKRINLDLYYLLSVIRSVQKRAQSHIKENDEYLAFGALNSLDEVVSELILSDRNVKDNISRTLAFDFGQYWPCTSNATVFMTDNWQKTCQSQAVMKYFEKQSDNIWEVMLQKVKEEAEDLYSPTLDLLLSNIRALLITKHDNYQLKHEAKLDHAISLLTVEFLTVMGQLEKLESERSRLFSQEFLERLSEYF